MNRQTNQSDQLLKEIQNMLNSSCRHKHFNADAVFLIPSPYSKDLSRIILIYQDNSEISSIDRKETTGDRYIFFRINEIYSMILEKNIFLYYWFQYAIPIYDHVGIVPVILSSLKPIHSYNRDINKIYYYKYENLLSIKFYGITCFKSFITNIIFPLCSILSEVMDKCSLIVAGDTQQNNIQNNYGLISLYSKKIDMSEIKSLIQKSLYQNYIEWDLARIEFPTCSLFSGLLNFSNTIAELSLDLLSNISNFFMQDNISNEWSLGYSASKLISIYIIMGKNLFHDINNFMECNDLIITKMLDSIVSEYSVKHISFEQSDAVLKKTILEYNQLSQQNATSLFENYLEELRLWNIIATDDEVVQTLNCQLTNILNVFRESYLINNCNNKLCEYFFELYKSTLSIYRIPVYFHAYIPYCIKFIYNHAI